MVLSGCVCARKLLFIVVIFLKMWTTQNKEILVGVWTQSDVRKESWKTLSNTQFLSPQVSGDLVQESSNWALEEAQHRDLFEYEALFNTVKKKFRQNHSDVNLQINFEKIPFDKRDNVFQIIRKLEVYHESYDALIHGFMSDETFQSNAELICEVIDESSAIWNDPIISWMCLKNPTKTKKESTLLHVQPAVETTVKSVISILRSFNWRKVAFLMSSLPTQWNSFCNNLEQEILSSNSFTIHFTKTFSDKSNENNEVNFIKTWNEIYNADVSVVVMCLPHGFGNLKKHSTILDDLMRVAYDLDHMKAKTIPYLAIDNKGLYKNTKIDIEEETKSKTKRNVRNENLFSSFGDANETKLPTNSVIVNKQGSSMITNIKRRSAATNYTGFDSKEQINATSFSVNDIYENILIISPILQQEFPITHKQLVLRHRDKVEISDLSYFLDSLYLMMTIITKVVQDYGFNSRNDGRKAFSTAQNLGVIEGFTGPISFDINTKARSMDYVLWDIKHTGIGYQLTEAMIIDTTSSDKYFKVTKTGNISWSSFGAPPGDICEEEYFYLCNYQNEGLQTRDFLIAMFSGTGLYVIGYSFYLFLRKKKEWHALLRGPNKLFLSDADIKLASFNVSNRQNIENISREPSMQGSRVGSLITLVDNNIAVDDDVIAMLKGDYVYLKCVSGGPIEARKATRDILRQLRELRHENVCSFHGLYWNGTSNFLVMEYGYRRSLKELIANKDCELNWTFKISLLHDLVRGMKYLHASPIHCHGRLKSRNCIVDGRFVLKITDYGVNKLRNLGPLIQMNNNSKDLLWTSPELLKDPALRQVGTQKGDSFSFAIICQELILRQDPYSMHDLNADELIEKLKKSPPLIRPSVKADAAPIELIQIMKQCWQEQPELRLTFSAINTEIKRMNRGKKYNIVESMMKQLEDYSSHLEELVNERTAELGEEKKKTEQLLMRMLPPSVAKLLMANKKIIPESFESCTIYFSDICGFTTIAHASTPMQVVDFLNDLYTCFDAIIENHEVYKVETIGDAYMVSSGIPKVIGNRHAEEASLMALDIMSATTTFRVRHLPDVDLRIRIGMHSGSAVAGVVGLTMPRYCLFGDTINTASRLETTGIPSRIHISSDTKQLLEQSQRNFKLQKRGMIELKGRGTMTTWWLLGMDGFTKPLPDPGKINEPSHGIKIENSANKSTNNSNHVKCQTLVETRRQQFEDKLKNTNSSIRCGKSSLESYTDGSRSPEIFTIPCNFNQPNHCMNNYSDVTITPKSAKLRETISKKKNPISVCFGRKCGVSPMDVPVTNPKKC